MSRPKRLYIITGKGGVGKTTTALALTKHLNSQGSKARYLNFTTTSLSSANSSTSERQEILLAQKMGIPFTALNLLECSQGYVGKKMKSQTIAKWVVRTPFYKALMSMLPGFNYLIYLGKTLEILKEDEELTFVLDSPSSGHALTMLEATKNFGEIFQSGLLFEDTQKMKRLLHSEGFAQINILSLPILMAVNEGLELRESLCEIAQIETKLFCNNSFKSLEGVGELRLPPFLEAKLEVERAIEERHGGQITSFIKHSLSNLDEQIVEDLAPCMNGLV